MKRNDLKNILNELIISFFNKNLKGKKEQANYNELASKYEISIIVEEYYD